LVEVGRGEVFLVQLGEVGHECGGTKCCEILVIGLRDLYSIDVKVVD